MQENLVIFLNKDLQNSSKSSYPRLHSSRH